MSYVKRYVSFKSNTPEACKEGTVYIGSDVTFWVMIDDHLAAMEAKDREIERLKEQNGFVPDWGKAPEWATAVQINWVAIKPKKYPEGMYFDRTTAQGGYKKNEYEDQWQEEGFIPRPIPPKVTRERTTGELYKYLLRHYSGSNPTIGDSYLSAEKIALELADGNSLKDLCTVAGISLTTKEE